MRTFFSATFLFKIFGCSGVGEMIEIKAGTFVSNGESESIMNASVFDTDLFTGVGFVAMINGVGNSFSECHQHIAEGVFVNLVTVTNFLNHSLNDGNTFGLRLEFQCLCSAFHLQSAIFQAIENNL